MRRSFLSMNDQRRPTYRNVVINLKDSGDMTVISVTSWILRISLHRLPLLNGSLFREQSTNLSNLLFDPSSYRKTYENRNRC